MSFQRTLLFSLVISAGAFACHRSQEASQGSGISNATTDTGTMAYDGGSTGDSYNTGASGTDTGTTDTGTTDAGSPGYGGSTGGTGMATDAGVTDAGFGDGGIRDGGTLGDGGTRTRGNHGHRDAGSSTGSGSP